MGARLLLTTFGSLGDLHPYLALAHALKARGHHPIIATSEIYRSKIEADSLEFAALRPALPMPQESQELIRRIMDGRRGTEYLYRELLVPALRDSYDDLLRVAQNCDAMIAHAQVVLAAPLVAEKLQIPWLSTAFAPIAFGSIYDPSLLPLSLPGLLRYLPGILMGLPPRTQRAFKNQARRVALRWLQEVRTFRTELGLKPASHPIFDDAFSPCGTLAMFSKILGEPQSDWPLRTIQTGTCFYDHLGNMPEGETPTTDSVIAEFLADGEPPIVFTLGSAAVFDARDFFEESLKAARILKRRAILLIGHEKNRPPGLKNDSQVVAFDYAPFSQLFPSAAAVVHQGGAGTTAQVLRAAAPSLVIPHAHDQPDHAFRLQRLGVARTLSRREYSARAAAYELQLLLQPEYSARAAHYAAIVQAEHGPQNACDVIESLLENL